MTVLTDYLLGALGLVCGARLWSSAGAKNRTRRLWAGMLLAMAVAAFAGGTAHGWADRLSETGHWALWRITVWSIGVGSFLIVAATARHALSAGWRRAVMLLAALQFAIYAVWMFWHDSFGYVILQYFPAMLFVLCVVGWRWLVRDWAGGKWIVAGILVSFAAAGVQVSGFSLHRNFNHNDLYHVIQMLGVLLLYRGGRLLSDRADRKR